jgi:predicted phage-related endonuclease
MTKTGLAEPEDIGGKLPVKIGNRLEQLIIEEFAEQSGRLVTPWPAFHLVRHPSRPYVSCTPDAEEWNPDCLEERIGLVQVKAVSAYMDRHWKPGEAPLHYQVQCQAELAVVGCDHSTLVALVGNSHLRWLDLPRDDHFIGVMLDRLEEFWHHVETRTPPAIDWSESCTRALERLHPKDQGHSVELPPEAAEWDAELAEIKGRIKELEQARDLRENQLRAAIGPASFGVLPDGGKWSWKWQERKGYVVQPTEFRKLSRVKGKSKE